MTSSQIRFSKFGLRSFVSYQTLYPIQRIEKLKSLTELRGHENNYLFLLIKANNFSLSKIIFNTLFFSIPEKYLLFSDTSTPSTNPPNSMNFLMLFILKVLKPEIPLHLFLFLSITKSKPSTSNNFFHSKHKLGCAQERFRIGSTYVNLFLVRLKLTFPSVLNANLTARIFV